MPAKSELPVDLQTLLNRATGENVLDKSRTFRPSWFSYLSGISYLLQCVAPVCGFAWSQDDVDCMSAQLMYVDWLRTGDDSIIQEVV